MFPSTNLRNPYEGMYNSTDIVAFNRAPRIVVQSEGVEYNLTGLESDCPFGFVLPDNPSDPDIEWVNGTNCAISCLSPITERGAFLDGQVIVDFFGWLGFIGLCINLMSYKVSPKEMHYLTYYNVRFALAATFFTILQSFQKVEDRFCRDNANAISGRDGFVLCNVQATVAIYVSAGTVLCWAAQIFHIFNLIVIGQTEAQANAYKEYYKWGMVGEYNAVLVVEVG